MHSVSFVSFGVLQVGSSLREGLLLGVVEHLLSIDADIKWQEIVDAPTGGLCAGLNWSATAALAADAVAVKLD
jgi:hypothetical protein